MIDISLGTALILICSGLIVGFINTLAAGGTVISISIFMFFGLDPIMASGTNRIAIFFQNLSAVYQFQKHKLINWKVAFNLAIPTVLGGITGSFWAGAITESLFQYIFCGVIIFFSISLLFNSEKWIRENAKLQQKPVSIWVYLIFFAIGFYAGFAHVGVGYFLLGGLALCVGFDLVKANVLKNVLVLLYVPFSLLIYALQGNVCWTYGLIHAIGNIFGATIAAHYAVKKGYALIKYMMLLLAGVVVLQLLGII